jgi:hypothetical protein
MLRHTGSSTHSIKPLTRECVMNVNELKGLIYEALLNQGIRDDIYCYVYHAGLEIRYAIDMVSIGDRSVEIMYSGWGETLTISDLIAKLGSNDNLKVSVYNHRTGDSESSEIEVDVCLGPVIDINISWSEL